MDRCKTLLLALSLIVGLGLTVGCDQGVKKTEDEKASAEAAEKTEETKDQEKAEPTDGLPVEATGPVAVVNGQEITAEEFNEVIEKQAAAMQGRPLDPRMAEMMKQRTLDRLIDQKLIEKQLADAKVEVSAEKVEEEFSEFKERFPNEEAFQTFLTNNKIDAAEMKENLKKDLTLRALLSEKYGIDITDADAQKYYEENAERFNREEEVRARHILIKTEKGADETAIEAAKKKAEEIAKEAKKPGTDFAELAKTKSEGPTAPRGGDLGFFSKKRMVPEFSEVAFNMKPGEISEPVKSQFGYHVIKVEEKKEAGKVPFEEVKEQIVMQLEQQKYREGMKKFLTEIKEGVEVVRNEDNIKVNATAPAAQPGMGGMGGMGGPGGQQLPPEIQKQLQEQIRQAQQKQQQQQQQQGGGEEPGKMQLKEPTLGK